MSQKNFEMTVATMGLLQSLYSTLMSIISPTPNERQKKKKLGILFYPRPWYPPTSTCWVEQTAPFATTCVDVALVKTVMVIWGIRLGQAAPSLFLVGLMRCR
jgi:hypothetical protein